VKSFLVQFVSEPDPSHLPNEWTPVDAEDPRDAVARMLRKTHTVPEAGQQLVAFVSLGQYRHPNGAPMAVQKMVVTRT